MNKMNIPTGVVCLITVTFICSIFYFCMWFFLFKPRKEFSTPQIKSLQKEMVSVRQIQDKALKLSRENTIYYFPSNEQKEKYEQLQKNIRKIVANCQEILDVETHAKNENVIDTYEKEVALLLEEFQEKIQKSGSVHKTEEK